MFKQFALLFLALLILNPAFYTSSAQASTLNSKSEKEAKITVKVKSEINKLGSGKEVQVKVKMKNGTKLKGYVSDFNEDNFIVVDTSGKATTIPYSGVKQVTGKNNLTGKEIAIVAGAILLLILIAVSGVV